MPPMLDEAASGKGRDMGNVREICQTVSTAEPEITEALTKLYHGGLCKSRKQTCCISNSEVPCLSVGCRGWDPRSTRNTHEPGHLQNNAPAGLNKEKF